MITNKLELYPDSICLDYDYYCNSKYNKTRRNKILLFSNCLGVEYLKDKNVMIQSIKNKSKEVKSVLKSMHFSKSIINNIIGYLFEFIPSREYISKKIEKGCMLRTIELAKTYNILDTWDSKIFINLYHDICYKTSINLDSSSCIHSEYIKNKIIYNNINLLDIGGMTSKELCPEKYIKIDIKLAQMTNTERKIKYSELYHCRKCKKNQCVTERRYARSLDEGVDLTVNCIFCGHSWNA